MLLKDVMNKNVVAVRPDISLKDAAKTMYDRHIGSLIVVDDENIVGILTQSDIIKAVTLEKILIRRSSMKR